MRTNEATQRPLFLANAAVHTQADLVVLDKYSGRPAFRVAQADAAMVEKSLRAAMDVSETMRRMPSHRRQAALLHVVGRVSERKEELAQILCVEVGKPIRDARGEVTRLIDTFRIAAEEAVRITGEYLPLDISARAEGVEGITRRFPVGPCSFITPFNFPLNLVAHKIAPAIAAGCPFILKPASWTPVSALLLGEILAETELPPGAFSILPCTRETAQPLITDDRVKLISFTGSPEVGWDIKRRAGKKKVVLELGSNAACIVDRDADLDWATERITFGAFYQSGQSCISVQRIYIHSDLYVPLKERLVARASSLKMGDPREESTFLGPMISEDDAKRVEQWIGEAVAAGARRIGGGKRSGAMLEATLLENVDPRQRISCVEAFGPVATIDRFDDFKGAVAAVNHSVYGLQAGVFTNNLHHAWYAFHELDVGSVIINDVPSFRVDSMPYGGVKNSGIGREGVRYAIAEMTEPKLLVFNKIGRIT